MANKEDKEVLEILELCKSLDEKSYIIYNGFSTLFKNERSAPFWEEMATYKHEHIKSWDTLIELSKLNIIPQIYENPNEVKKNLLNIRERIEELLPKSVNINDDRAFIIACRLEFYLIHPALESLMDYIKNIPFEGLAMLSYEKHIDDFFKGIESFSHYSPELQLLSEVIKVLWQKNKHLAKQSSFDTLTGIFNRRGFVNAITPLTMSAMARRQKTGIMMLDVDNFKNINDLFGHSYGDKVLMFIGDIIRKSIRTFDVVARYGGDEFVVFISPCEEELIYDMADNIRQIINTTSEKGRKVTISIGVECRKVDDKPRIHIDDSIKIADKYLYLAKNNGKNKVVSINHLPK